MAGGMSLYERIDKAEVAIGATKKKYNDALDVLEKLLAMRNELDDKKVLKAYNSGQKTADAIIAFIYSGDEDEKPKRPVKRTYKKR